MRSTCCTTISSTCCSTPPPWARAYVEREGVSVRHAARFLLVGTMNPEEGELRPQLLDRFGLAVDVRASRDPEERAEVVRRRLGVRRRSGCLRRPLRRRRCGARRRGSRPPASCCRMSCSTSRATPDHQCLRGFRRRRAARRPGHGEDGDRARRLGRAHRRDRRRRAQRRPARAAAPARAAEIRSMRPVVGLDEEARARRSSASTRRPTGP